MGPAWRHVVCFVCHTDRAPCRTLADNFVVTANGTLVDGVLHNATLSSDVSATRDDESTALLVALAR